MAVFYRISASRYRNREDVYKYSNGLGNRSKRTFDSLDLILEGSLRKIVNNI